MGWFDVHAHLTSPHLVDREAELLANAKAAGVTTILSNGLNPRDNQAVWDLSKRSELVRPCFGLYPVDAVMPGMIRLGIDYPRDEEPADPQEAVQWVADHVEHCVAVGEIGLDHYWVPEDLWEEQEGVFRQLVQIAIDADKPIIIHTRKAERRTFEILAEMGAKRVDWHCFGGKVKLARRIADELEGHYFSIPSNVRRSQSFTRMVQTLPRERILLETDCPYLAPEPGGQSEPAHVAGSAAFMAEEWGVSLDEVREQLESNFERLMGFRP